MASVATNLESLAPRPRQADPYSNVTIPAPAVEAFPSVQVRIDGHHPLGWANYAPVSFTITAEDHAEVAHTVGMGGFTDWTRRLLGREEERLLVSTVATDVACESFGTPPPRSQGAA